MAILFLSRLSLSTKIISKSKTSTNAVSLPLSGNQWEKIADEVHDNKLRVNLEIQNKNYLMAYDSTTNGQLR